MKFKHRINNLMKVLKVVILLFIITTFLIEILHQPIPSSLEQLHARLVINLVKFVKKNKLQTHRYDNNFSERFNKVENRIVRWKLY